MMNLIVAAIMALLVVSCAMPQTKVYSLSIAEGKKNLSVRTDSAISISVRSPRYLSQAYIASRISPYQIDISRYSKWDAPPSDIVREALKEAISSAGIFREVRASNLPADGFHWLEVHLRRFERFDSGDLSFADISFEAVLRSPDGREIYSGVFSRKIQLDDNSYLTLARQLSGSLSEGLSEIRSGVVNAVSTGG